MIATILEKYESFLKEERQMKPRTIRDYIDYFKIISSRVDVLTVRTYKDVNDCIKAIRDERRYSVGSVYKVSICVKHFFRWLQREGLRPDNPYPFSEWRRPRPEVPEFITVSQFQALIDDPNLTHQELTLLYLLWDTGARIGEIEQLTQDNIDLEKGLVTITYEISKGSYSHRSVPISPECIELLKKQFLYIQRRGHQKTIFVSQTNEPMTRSGMQKLISNIGMRNSPLRPVMRLSPHRFRHSCGIRWIEKGIPQVIVQKWLGHQSLEMTSRYISVDSESSRRLYDQYYQNA